MTFCHWTLGISLGKSIGKGDWIIYHFVKMLKFNWIFFNGSGNEGEDSDKSWDCSSSPFYQATLETDKKNLD